MAAVAEEEAPLARKRSVGANGEAGIELGKRRRMDETEQTEQRTEGRTEATEQSDSDLDLPKVFIAPHISRLLQNSDSESESSASSSSSSSDDEGVAGKRSAKPAKTAAKARKSQPAAPGANSQEAAAARSKGDLFAEEEAAEIAAEKAQQAGLVPTAQKSAPKSPSSSSSSSSSSDSEDESMALSRMGATPAESVVGEPPKPKLSHLAIVQNASLRREDLALLLANLPFEVAEAGVVRSFVRLAVEAKGKAGSAGAEARGPSGADAVFLLAEVTGIEPCEGYKVNRAVGHPLMVKARIMCKRGNSQRLVKVGSASNGAVTDAELEQWKRLTAKTGVDTDALVEQAEKKPAEINRARNFVYTEEAVGNMVRLKGDTSSDAQKESRLHFLVATTQSQMDISNIRDNEARELEQKYQDTLSKLQIQEAKSTDMQSSWFESKPGLFSLKMINKKNYERQVADDKHALQWTLENESGGGGALNPFERSACRPLVAWDTVLTQTENLPTNKEADKPQGEQAPEQAAEVAATDEAGVAPDERMRRYVRGSLGALPILRGLGLNI